MTESRYPGLDQANGEHRDGFTSRYADPQGYDSGAQAAAGPGGSGSAGGGYEPPPARTGPDSGSTHSISPSDLNGLDLSKIGGTSTYGGKGGPPRPPAAAAPPPAPPKPAGPPPSVGGYGSPPPPPSNGGYGSGFGGAPSGYSNGSTGLTQSVTGYDPANYPPPTPYIGGSGLGSDGPDGSTYRVGRDGTIKKLGVDTQTNMPPATGMQTSTMGGSSARTSVRSALSSAAGRSGPRRARLQLKHIDPWTTMKFTLVLSVAMFVVWMIAVGLLYGVLGGLGVWDQVNNLYDQVAGGNLISAKFVLTSAAVVGVINIVLFTALATIGSFVYNLCSDLVGGIELTLSERD
jgi:Transmembrane domain of unknown function (DUF3566)